MTDSAPTPRRSPWMKWYPRDWRAEPTLRMCSRAARSLWQDFLGLMHDEGEPYGHLTIKGRAPTTAQLVNMFGGTGREIDGLIAELESAGVFSRTDDGVIYSRRMVRDKAKADSDRANGKWGGNPKITVGVNLPVNPNTTQGDKAQKPEARSQNPDKDSQEAKSTSPRSRALPPAQPNRLTGRGLDLEDKAVRKQVWEQRVMTYIRSKCEPDEAEKIILAYVEGKATGKTAFENADRAMRAAE